MISLNFGVVGRELLSYSFIEMKGLEDLLSGGTCSGECSDLTTTGFTSSFAAAAFSDFCKMCNGIGLNDPENIENLIQHQAYFTQKDTFVGVAYNTLNIQNVFKTGVWIHIKVASIFNNFLYPLCIAC